MTTTTRALTTTEETYLRFLLTRDEDECAGIAELLAANPERANELLELHEQWQRPLPWNPASEGTVISELTSFHGEGVDPKIRLSASGEGDGYSEDSTGVAFENGGYEFIHKLAEGRLGTVLAVRDRNLGCSLAMKVHGEDAALEEFLREARIIANLAHPGVPPVHELGVDADGRAFFTMPRLRGVKLGKVFDLARRGAEGWSLTRAVGVLIQVCDTISATHEEGVVHGDLRPDNVMVGDFGEVVITGWGRARTSEDLDLAEVDLIVHGELSIASALTAGGEELTDPGSDDEDPDPEHYSAPELIDGAVLPRADIYSLGTLLYRLLSGHAPSPARARSFPVRTSRRLIAICRRAMHPDPAQRYPDAQSIADELRAYREHRVVRAHRTGALAELEHWIRRNRGVALSSVATVAIIVFGLTQYISDKERRSEEILQLAEGEVLSVLEKSYESLWPFRGREDEIARLGAWKVAAERLQEHLDGHRDELERLELQRAAGRDGPNGVLEADLPKVAASSAARVAALGGESLARIEGLAPTEALARARVDIEFAMEASERNLVFAQLNWAKGHGNRVPTTGELWRIGALNQLIDRVEFLEVPGLRKTLPPNASGKLPRVRKALEFDRQWRKAITEITNSPFHGDLELTEQYGLVPLEPDEESGLWEFWHARTGEEPKRRSDDQEWDMQEDTGMVFVLMPATATLEPFLISKYEMTQGQWGRFSNDRSYFATGTAESRHFGIQGNHPQEQMKPEEARACLQHAGFTIPTVRQWEHAARGGTTTRFWFGDRAEDVVGNERIKAGTVSDDPCRPSRDAGEKDPSGYEVHAPVGSFEPNPYGLHDIWGNVAEWCRRGEELVVCGGHFDMGTAQLEKAITAREVEQKYQSSRVGVRPVLEVAQ
jgi:serine/threonine protein kinase